MEDKLKAIEARYSHIQAQLGAGETYDDPALVAKLNREQRELAPIVDAFCPTRSSRRWPRRNSPPPRRTRSGWKRS